MNPINRHNYEEYLLLYVDGELPVADQRMVEQFLQENPDLHAELAMLQHTRLVPDEIVPFDHKHLLYQLPHPGIDGSNYEPYFLSYVDGELDAAGKEAVTVFIAANPTLKEELALLEQARLTPETVVFPYKQSLYRIAGEERPVIAWRWWKIAAAAAVMGLAVVLWTLVPEQHQVPNQPLAIVNPPAKSAAGKAKSTGNPLIPSRPVAAPRETVMEQKKPAAVIAAPANTAIAIPEKAEPQTVAVLAPAGTGGTTAILAPALINATLPEKGTAIENNTLATVVDHPVAQPTVYKELDTDDESKSLYLGSIELNKDKLRGFFRKASSIFKSKAAREEEGNTRTLK